MSTSACITTYSTRRSTTIAPGEKLKTATTSSSQMAALPNTSRVQSSALYRVHLSAAPCTPGKTDWSRADLVVSHLSIASNHGRKARPPAPIGGQSAAPQLCTLPTYPLCSCPADGTLYCCSGPVAPLEARPPKPSSRLPHC